MNIVDRAKEILYRYGVEKRPEPTPEPEPKPTEPDPLDDVRCPDCECNSWGIIRETQRKGFGRIGYHAKSPVLWRFLRLRCDHCKREWQLHIREQ